MTHAEAREAVYGRFTEQWDGATPVAYDGSPGFTEPNPPTAWARVSVRHLESSQDTLGAATARQFRRQMSIIVQVFSPAVSSIAPLDTLVTAARAIWEGQTFNGISILGGVQTFEAPQDGVWLQTNVEALADYYEVI